jgi:hypothetical protein
MKSIPCCICGKPKLSMVLADGNYYCSKCWKKQVLNRKRGHHE